MFYLFFSTSKKITEDTFNTANNKAFINKELI